MSRSRRPLRAPTPLVFAGALALAALTATEVQAQARSGGSGPSSGDWSIMFTVFEPNDVTNFGLFRMFGDRMNIGLEVDFDWAEGEQTVLQNGLRVNIEAKNWGLVLGPSVRWYGSRQGPVTPYLRGKIGIGWGDQTLFLNGVEQSNEDEFVLNASLGLGAEWFPIRSLGLAGHTGFTWTRLDRVRPLNDNGTQVDTVEQFFGTFRSGLVVNFYFR